MRSNEVYLEEVEESHASKPQPATNPKAEDLSAARWSDYAAKHIIAVDANRSKQARMRTVSNENYSVLLAGVYPAIVDVTD